MSVGRVPETPEPFRIKFHSVSNEINWNVLLWLIVGVLLFAMLGTGSYPLLGPDESRHAGIVHDMWAARQYLVPRVDGLPMLDGKPTPHNPQHGNGVNLNTLGFADPTRPEKDNIWVDWVSGAAVRQALPAKVEKVV